MRRARGARRLRRERELALVAAVAAVAAALTSALSPVAASASPPPGEGSSPTGVAAPVDRGGGSPAADDTADRVVVVGVAGLRWEDVGAAATPHVAAAATGGSVGSLSVRSAPSVTCPADGWLTLGAGGYAAVRDPAAVDPRLGCTGRPVPPVRPVGDAGRASVRESATLNERLRFDARPGWLAQQVSCVAAAGPGAGLAAADPAGRIDHYVPRPPATAAEVRGLVGRCAVALIDGGVLPENGGRPAALAELDELVGLVRAAVPQRTVVMVLGVSETVADRGHLHVAVVEGPGFGAGWLASTSARRVPYVQLADVAPTIADAVAGAAPDEVAGRPMVGGEPGRPASLAGVRRVLVETDVRAGAHRAVVGPFFAGLGVVVVAVCGALAVLLQRRRRGHAVPDRAVATLRSCAVGLAAVPAATFAANLVPWWRSGAPAAAVAVVVTACAAVLWALAAAVGARAAGPRRALAEVGTVAAASLVLLVADVVTGARLQIDSLLGYNPLVAGRFVGFGNIAFAVLGASAVVLGALVAHRRPPARAAAAVVLVGAPVVIVDGWPGWGADVGGVLTLVPVFAVLAMLAVGRRIRPWQAALTCAGGAAVAGTIGALDYARPADERSHFGRFVGTALDGGALDTIRRKADASLDLLTMGPHTVAAAAATIALTWVLVRPPALLREAYRVHGFLRPMHQATLVLAVIGLAVNDSIVAVPMVVALVVGPMTLALCAAPAPPVPAVEGGTCESC